MTLWNHDGVFFEVESTDVNFEAVATADVEALDIDEEMAKLDSGSITLRDPNHVYSRIIRPGAKLFISWGIRPTIGPEIRRDKIEVMVNSPGGGGASNGKISYKVNFTAMGFRGDYAIRWYETGTKGDVVADVLTRIGVAATDRCIDFLRMNEKVAGGTKIAQYESDFRFLVRLADEWRAAFRISRDRRGNPVACFVDYDKVSFIAAKVGGFSSMLLEYGDSAAGANCLSYTWRDNSMNSANGDSARIVMVDGKPQIYRTVVENQTVKTYRLVPERIEKELETRDMAGRTELLAGYLSAKDFKEVERFFVEDTTTTAPQGSGIEVEADIMGDPQVTAGLVVSFGYGFPDRIGSNDRTWWAKKASHKISQAGYFTGVTIADAYSFSPTGVKLTPTGTVS